MILMSIQDLAKFLKMSPRNIYRMLKNNELPFAMKIQGSWRFKQEDVMEWLENQKIKNKG